MQKSSKFGGTFGNGKGIQLRGNKDDDSFDGSRGSDFNNDLKQDFGMKAQQARAQMDQARGGNQNFNQTMKKQTVNNYKPPYKSSISDIVDKDEREAVFRSSMQNDNPQGKFFGGFPSDVQNHPPGQSYIPFMNGSPTQTFQQSIRGGEQSLMSTSPRKSSPARQHFSKFVPKTEKTELKQNLIKEIEDFSYTPKKLYCKKHRDQEIEFCCLINEAFYCKLCAPTHLGHDDAVLAEVCKTIQDEVVKLKHTYIQKKENIIKKLDTHQDKMEQIFKVYYDQVDEMRQMMLGQEYSLRGDIDYFEKTIKDIMGDVKNYNFIEFYHESINLKRQIKDIKGRLKSFNVYMPKYQLANEDINHAINQIKIDVKERFNNIMREVDHSFALGNFDYVTKIQTNDSISKIYKQLGPFNFFQQKAEEDVAEDKNMQDHFDKRKSGAQFRGEISVQTTKPDGKGFKIFPNGSIYEGFFQMGQTHGQGRGISSKGEVYEGEFKFDMMDGKGFFVWPDGRMYEGEWKQGKKSGQGKYFWPNGQVYVGEFKDNECNGSGTLHYPDGKKFEGNWKNGKKNGKCCYIWPNGSRYYVFYLDGRKQGEGQLENSTVSVQQLKESYQSLAKKSLAGKNLLINNKAAPF